MFAHLLGNPDFCLKLAVQGKMALKRSSSYCVIKTFYGKLESTDLVLVYGGTFRFISEKLDSLL